MFQQSSTQEALEKTFCPAFDVLQRPIRTNKKRCQMFSFTFICNIKCS